jgi:hypothetical protein
MIENRKQQFCHCGSPYHSMWPKQQPPQPSLSSLPGPPRPSPALSRGPNSGSESRHLRKGSPGSPRRVRQGPLRCTTGWQPQTLPLLSYPSLTLASAQWQPSSSLSQAGPPAPARLQVRLKPSRCPAAPARLLGRPPWRSVSPSSSRPGRPRRGGRSGRRRACRRCRRG